MTIAPVQTKSAGNAGITTVGITLDAAPTANNLLIACITYRADRTLSAPAGWSQAKDEQAGTSANTHTDTAIWYKVSAGTETSTTWTISNTGWIIIAMHEYSGCLTSGVLDVVNGAHRDSGTTKTLDSGTTSTGSQASQVVVATWGVMNDTTGRSFDNSFVETLYLNNATAGASLTAAAKVVSSAAAYQTTFTWTSTGDWGSGAIAAFNGITAVTGTEASTLPTLTAVLAGTETFTGTEASTLPTLTAVASGVIANPVTGTVAQSLNAVTAALTGAETFTGTLASDLPTLTVVAAGIAASPVTADLASDLPALTADLAGLALGGATVDVAGPVYPRGVYEKIRRKRERKRPALKALEREIVAVLEAEKPLEPFFLQELDVLPLQKRVDRLLETLKAVEAEQLRAWKDDEEAILMLMRAV